MPIQPQKLRVFRMEVHRRIAAMSRSKRRRQFAKLAQSAEELSFLWLRLEDHFHVRGQLSRIEWSQLRAIIRHWPRYSLLEQRTVYEILHRLNTMAVVMDQDSDMLEDLFLGMDPSELELDDPDEPPYGFREDDEELDEDEEE